MLPNIGFIVEEDGIELIAGFIVITNSPIFLIEWIVGNPEVEWEVRKEALHLLVDTASNWSKKHGASFVMHMTNNERLIEKLENMDFNITDKNNTHLIRGL